MWFSLDSLGNGSVLKLCAVQTQHYARFVSIRPNGQEPAVSCKIKLLASYKYS